MEKEFNLSEILKQRKKALLKFNTDTAHCAKHELDDFEEDVKEFIRRLKDNLNSVDIELSYNTLKYQLDMIDKLAGDKLR